MNLVKTFFFFFSVVMVLSGASFSVAAEKGHAHKSPHGGLVQEAAGLHAEFLIDKSGRPKLYLYDKSMKPVDRSDGEAKLTIKGDGGAEETRVLKFSKDPNEGAVFSGEPIKGMTDWEAAIVNLKLKDKSTDIRFSRSSDGHGH